MAENSKRKRLKPWKTIVINGKRKYIFGEILKKDQSKVRELHGLFSRLQNSDPENMLCTGSTASTSAETDTINNDSMLAESESLSQSLLRDDDGNDSEPDNTSISPNCEVSPDVAYSTELSRLEMVTVVTNCTFVFPDFNVESKQIKV